MRSFHISFIFCFSLHNSFSDVLFSYFVFLFGTMSFFLQVLQLKFSRQQVVAGLSLITIVNI